jgi:hypothetical protein
MFSRCDDGERRAGRREWTMTREWTTTREDGSVETRRSLGKDDERRARAVWTRESDV